MVVMSEESASAFTATTRPLTALLAECADGAMQLPDFQRSWVWDEERIKSLIASISRGFPVGAIMSLRTGGSVRFKPRPVEGTPDAVATRQPDALLLDGQQRMTSLYQVLLRGKPVHTVTPRQQKVVRWFYIDIRKSIDPAVDRDDAIVSVPESKQLTSDFGRQVDLDLTTRAAEIANMHFPVHEILQPGSWQQDYIEHHMNEDFARHFETWKVFEAQVLRTFANYQIPVIELDKSTSKEAVCVVFEKVNTGGKALDAFELITATYAADGYQLRDDWYGSSDRDGRESIFREYLRLPSAPEGVLSGVRNTDFLQVVSLFHTRELRRAAEAAGGTGRELPQVSVNRQALLNLPLEAYQRYQQTAEEGFKAAARFLINLGIFRVKDLPYQSQIVPLAAILSDLGSDAEKTGAHEKIARWFWNGVFGELYGSSTETRIARDFLEVPDWVGGGTEPTTVHDSTIRADRLRSMRMRLSAAYKGVNALLMKHGALDFRSGQAYTNTVFFDENVDIHHVFPQDWCRLAGIKPAVYDSIINKTPLSARTNRIIGGAAPSVYLNELERDSGGARPEQTLDDRMRSHLIDPSLLRSDDFEAFMRTRQAALVALIESATGKPVIAEVDAVDVEDFVDPAPEDISEADL